MGTFYFVVQNDMQMRCKNTKNAMFAEDTTIVDIGNLHELRMQEYLKELGFL